MKFGLTGINMGGTCDPTLLARLARLAEEVGYDSLWSADHVALADPTVRFPATMPIIDTVVSLTWLAAATSKIRLASGIIILPQRNPVVLAKQLASVDVLSGGRLWFGIGVGWNEPEMNAVGVSLHERGARTDEYLDAIWALWTMDKPEYHGKYVNFSGINAFPRPVQKPAPPLVVGGYTPASYRRAWQRGSGWYGYGLDVEKARQRVDELRAINPSVQRPRELGELEISVCPADIPEPAMVAAYANAGVHRLVLRVPQDAGPDGVAEFVRRHAPAAA